MVLTCNCQNELLTSIMSLLGIIIASVGLVIAVHEYIKSKRNKTIRQFVDQITAYYAEEQEAIKWIAELSDNKIPKLQEELRKRAQKSEINPDKVYPKMTPKKAESYL